MEKQIKIDYVTISVNVAYKDGETVHGFNDSLSLNFNSESEMNRALTDKAYLAGVVKDVVNKAISSHNTENKEAKKLLKDLGV